MSELVIAAEGTYSDVEHDFIENEPPGLFPGDQDSYWGQARKVYADYLQGLADMLAQWYVNLDPRTVDEADMHNWEVLFGLPVNPANRSLEQRRSYLSQRFERGPFTRTRRRRIVESFIVATFGAALSFTPEGIPFDASGMPFFSGEFDLTDTYNIVEDIPNFTYGVRVLDGLDIDTVGLQRELGRITPGGIDFLIEEVVNLYWDGATATLAGNEITDVWRQAAWSWLTTQSGGGTDGAAVPGGIYIGRAATNLHRYGQCSAISDVNTTHYATSLDATVRPPYSTQSLKLVGDGLTAEIVFSTAAGLARAAGTPCAGSFWVKAPLGATFNALMRINNTDASTTSSPANIPVTGTGAWQEVVIPPLAVAVGKTGDKVDVRFSQAPARVETLWVAHAMIEAAAGVTFIAPYVPTSGATATRAAARMQAPAALLDETQAFLAVRGRWGFPSTETATHRVFSWADDGNHRIEGLWDNSQKLRLFRESAGGSPANSAVLTFAKGDPYTLVIAWTATQLKISVNNAVFVTQANTNIPVLAATMFDIGRYAPGASEWLDGRAMWVISGKGPVTQGDVATLAALSDDVDSIHPAGLPTSLVVTAVMPMRDSTYYVPLTP